MCAKTFKSIVVYSGGQDSTTCLAEAIQIHGASNVLAVNFAYGAKNGIEVESARDICEKWGVEYMLLELDIFSKLGSSNLLTTCTGDTSERSVVKDNLPSSWVPNRNTLFFTIAHAIAQKYGAEEIVTGACDYDEEGYPDTRAHFIGSIQYALNVGSEADIAIHAPLLGLSKGETFMMADRLGVLDVIINDTHTCYNGDRNPLNEWGYGCGKCSGCRGRIEGWAEYKKIKSQN